MMVGGFSHREMSFNILQLFNVLFVLSFLLEAACGFRVERCSPAGDIIEKSASLTIGRHRISIRECDQVAGDGNAHWFNRTHCRCSYGQSFVVDPNENIPEPKCMQKYGQDKDDLSNFWPIFSGFRNAYFRNRIFIEISPMHDTSTKTDLINSFQDKSFNLRTALHNTLLLQP